MRVATNLDSRRCGNDATLNIEFVFWYFLT